MPSNDVITTETSDGFKLAIHHIPAVGSARAAVVLQHGLGSNALGWLFPERSFAHYLAAQGFDCYVPELRGAGASQRSTTPYGIDEYIEHDIPAIISAVQRASGRQTLRWVGHSMGGILLLMYGMENPSLPIERFVAVGTALDYRPGKSVHRDTRKFRFLAGSWLPTLPFGRLTALNGLVAGAGPLFPAEQMNFWRHNIEPHVMRRMLSRGFTPIPMRLLDDLDTTFTDPGMRRKGGSITYLDRASNFSVPTCLIAGSRDAQATPESVTETARLLSGVQGLEVVRFGKDHGHAEDYGHVDLLIGRNAEREVWPTISERLGR